MTYQRDHIAACLASATIPYLFFGIDCEPVGASAPRAWSDTLNSSAQQDIALFDHPLNRHGFGVPDLRGIYCGTVREVLRGGLRFFDCHSEAPIYGAADAGRLAL